MTVLCLVGNLYFYFRTLKIGVVQTLSIIRELKMPLLNGALFAEARRVLTVLMWQLFWCLDGQHNKYSKCKPIKRHLEWFYLLAVTCFGPYLEPSAGSHIKYASCYWNILIWILLLIIIYCVILYILSILQRIRCSVDSTLKRQLMLYSTWRWPRRGRNILWKIK
jgi:hypothetical protein